MRCDIRLNASNGRKLASGEMKRPEHKDGRDARSEALREDARNKAVARGLPYYFTCNMAEVVLYQVATAPAALDKEVRSVQLAPINRSSQVLANWADIEANWIAFIDDLEERLRAVETTRPSVATRDVIIVRDTITAIAEEAIDRVMHKAVSDQTFADQIRTEAFASFGFPVALDDKDLALTREELLQVLRLGAFVVAQKLLLYRVLAEVGPKRSDPFKLDPLPSLSMTTDPSAVQAILHQAAAHAIKRSKDYETAFSLHPLDEVLFLSPDSAAEIAACAVGEVWQNLLVALDDVSWEAISRNIIGYLYEAIVWQEFRHELGQYYTPEDVVDLLVTFAIRESADSVLDPACGGGSFLRSAYDRKRDLGATHEQALRETWGIEITAFAAELSTVTLATADPYEPAAYPRVLLNDFFNVKPGMVTELQLPDQTSALRVPATFDAIIGNPPYISYRRQTNQPNVLKALGRIASKLDLPEFSGKSDEYVWFMTYGTSFLQDRGRFSFIVSAAILFSDYGIPLIRFIGNNYRIVAVIDSSVERWFPDADTNTVMLFLEKEPDDSLRAENDIRFVRLRRPLAQLLPGVNAADRRDRLEDLVDDLVTANAGESDPRFMVNVVKQGGHGGLFIGGTLPKSTAGTTS